jgi:hypothetical protein
MSAVNIHQLPAQVSTCHQVQIGTESWLLPFSMSTEHNVNMQVSAQPFEKEPTNQKAN